MSRLDYISLSLIFFSVITIILGIIKIHTYPGKVAKARKHPQTQAIDVLSLLGLIIFPLWMAALVWAYSGAVIGKLYASQEDKSEMDLSGDTADDTPPSEEKDAGADEVGESET